MARILQLNWASLKLADACVEGKIINHLTLKNY